MNRTEARQNGRTCCFCRLGAIEYARAWEIQKELAERVASGSPDFLLLLEHPPTYTLGRRGSDANLLASRDTLAALGATLVHSDRGGDITFHGPGQLVGYPVIDLKKFAKGIHAYMRSLEETLICALGELGIAAGRNEGYTGVWVGGEKIAAMGVKVDAKRVTQHGFALNCSTDLSWFGHIVPCGISDCGVTSISRLLGREITPVDLAGLVAEKFGDVFGMEMIGTEPENLFSDSLKNASAEDALK